MPIRIRKSFKVAPGVRINVSNRGVRGSIGAGGVRYVTGGRRRAGRRSSCCLNTLLLLPVLLPARLLQVAYQRLRRDKVTL